SGGYFDCELSATVAGETIYPIRQGNGNYGATESMWWYYGEPLSVTTPQDDPLGRPWYHTDYGRANVGAWTVISDTPGAVVYIGSDGYVYAYPVINLSPCDTPVTGTYETVAYLRGLTGPNRTVSTGRF